MHISHIAMPLVDVLVPFGHLMQAVDALAEA
jgi:hypothetical protein